MLSVTKTRASILLKLHENLSILSKIKCIDFFNVFKDFICSYVRRTRRLYAIMTIRNEFTFVFNYNCRCLKYFPIRNCLHDALINNDFFSFQLAINRYIDIL